MKVKKKPSKNAKISVLIKFLKRKFLENLPFHVLPFNDTVNMNHGIGECGNERNEAEFCRLIQN